MTNNKQEEFKPTWLYIKQHSVTGLKYFGKTTRSYEKMLKYTGSGKRWLNHIKSHGKDKVITPWCHLYTDRETLVEEALSFSKYHNIEFSNEWANLVPENGLWGSGSVKGSKRSKETCKNIGDSRKGSKWSEESKKNFKKPKSPEHNRTLGEIRKGKFWWNNGTVCTMSKTQPGSNWVRGRLKK